MATPSAKDMLMQVKRYETGGPVQSEGLSRALNQHGLTQEQFDQNIRAYAAANTNPVDALDAMTKTGISMEDVTRAMGAKAVSDYFTIDPNQGEKAPGAVTSGYNSNLQSTWLASTTHGGQEGLNARVKDLATLYAGQPEVLRDLFVSSGASTSDLVNAGVDPSVLYRTVTANTSCPPGKTRNAAGNCVDTVVTPEPCPPGKTRNAAGNCVDIETPCPPGKTRNAAGVCVDIEACPAGQTRNAAGVCVGGTSCPSPEMRILLSDGSYKPAGDLLVEDKVRTQHETTLEWGDHAVTHVSLIPNEPRLMFKFDGLDFVCSHSHKFYTEEGKWVEAATVVANDMLSGKTVLEVIESSAGPVVSITVADAHTYVCEGLLSHNKTPQPSACPPGKTMNAAGQCVDTAVTTTDLVTAVTSTTTQAQLQAIIDAENARKAAIGTTTNPINTSGSAATNSKSGVTTFLDTYNTPTPFVAPTYTAPTVYQPLPTQPDIYGAGQTALDTAFRGSSARTAIPGMPGQFNYTTAAKLRPATGAGYTFTPPSVTSRPRSLLSAQDVRAYGGLGASKSQQFAQNRAAIDSNLRTMMGSTPALQNSSNYNMLRNRIMSGEFGDAQLAFDPTTAEGKRLQAMVSSLSTTANAPGITGGSAGITGGSAGTATNNTAAGDYAALGPSLDLNYGGYQFLREGGTVKKSEGTADLSARAMLDTIDSEAPVKRNLPKEAQDARRARIGQAPAVPQDYSGRDLTGELLNVASLATAPVPVLGDIAGLAADARMYQMHPEERTIGNYLLSGLGVLPFVPSVSAVKTAGKGVKTAAEELAALGTYYHGTDKNILDSAGNLNFKTGQRGAVFLTPDPSFANKYALNDTQLLPNDIDRMVAQGTPANEGASIYPVTPNVLNTFDINNKDHLAKLKSVVTVGGAQKARWKPIQEFIGQQIREENPWVAVERLLPDIKTAGFDSAFIEEMGRRNLAVFDPKNVESALANKGVKTAAKELADTKLARAAQQGYADQDFYHATKEDITEFDANRNRTGLGLTFLGTSPEFANQIIEDIAWRRRLSTKDMENKDIQNLKNRITNTDYTQSDFYRDKNYLNKEYNFTDSTIYPLRTNLQNAFDPAQEGDLLRDYLWGTGVDPHGYSLHYDNPIDESFEPRNLTNVEALERGGWRDFEKTEMIDFLKSKGFDSMWLRENYLKPDFKMSEPYSTLAKFDTSKIRSKFAKFDPDKLESRNIGHAKGGPVQKYATGNEVSSTTADLLAQMKAIGDMPNTPTPNAPTPNAPLAKEQTDSASMLDNLIRAYEQNISKPAVGSVIDMTLGLGDLGQMGAKYLANRAGIKTDPFVPTAEPAKAAAGVTGYDPYTIGGIATNLLPFARGKQAIGGAAKTFASMFPNLGREALSYAGGEAGAAAARELLPDSTAAQFVASLAGSVAGGVGGSSTMSNMAKVGDDIPPTDSAKMLNDLDNAGSPLAAQSDVPTIGATESVRPEITTTIGDRNRVGTTGRYIGAPKGVNSPQKLAAIIKSITNLTKEGEFGRFWYERSGRQILDLTGGNKNDAEKIIQAIAITSANTPVAGNFDFAVQAYYQWKSGQPIKTGMYTTAMSKKLQNMFEGQDWAGRKTNNFYNNLMREIDPSKVQGVTTDLWMMRAFGFDTDAPTTAQYSFVENETKRIAQNLGWEPQQVQAAIWVALKSRMENTGVKNAVEAKSIKNGWMHYEIKDGKKVRVIDDQNKHAANWLAMSMKYSPNDADRAAAGFDYADAAENNLAQISWETRPSRTSVHMPEIFDAAPEVVQDYHVSMSKGFLDDQGNDIIAKELGILSPGDFEAPGYFEGLTSPGTQMEVTVPRAYGVTRRISEIKKQAAVEGWAKEKLDAAIREATYATEPAAKEMMMAYAAVRGILLKQDGVGLHRPSFIEGLSRPKANGIEVNIGRPLTAAETSRIAKFVAEEAGHTEYNPIGSSSGVRFINFDYVGTSNLEFQKIINKALKNNVFDNGEQYDGIMFGADTGYLGNDWTENLNGERYLEAGNLAGRPDLQQKIRDIVKQLAPRVSAVEDEFSNRYGWTRNRELNRLYEAADETQIAGALNAPPTDKGIGSLLTEKLEGQSVNTDGTALTPVNWKRVQKMPVKQQFDKIYDWAESKGWKVEIAGVSDSTSSRYLNIKKPTNYDPEYGYLDDETIHVRIADHANHRNTGDSLTSKLFINIAPGEATVSEAVNDIKKFMEAKARGGSVTKKAKGGNVERVYNDRKYI